MMMMMMMIDLRACADSTLKTEILSCLYLTLLYLIRADAVQSIHCVILNISILFSCKTFVIQAVWLSLNYLVSWFIGKIQSV